MPQSKLNHLAIIMDGNRRWAKREGNGSLAGHKAGYENIKKVIELAGNNNIKYLTLWGLSTENLKKRPQDEIEGIIGLINQSTKMLPSLQENNIQFKTIGDTLALPKKTQEILQHMTQETQKNTGTTVTIALIYGGQDEIIRGIKKILESGLSPDDITQESFREYLDVASLPIPEVIVRTGGDKRTSGFLLYDSPYSELYFTDTYWPEFGATEFDNVLTFYSRSKRNFGK